MVYLSKLAKRLALAGPHCIIALGVLTACDDSVDRDFLSPSAPQVQSPSLARASSRTLVGMEMTPGSASLPTGTSKQFTVVGVYADGSRKNVPALWSTTGGAISTEGLYQAGSPGTFRVIARHKQELKADTALVTVFATEAPPVATLISLSVTPDSTTIQTGTTGQFSVTASWSDGSTTVPSIAWTSTGGAINGSGLYSAGSTAGVYRVIATSGTVSDTAVVSLAAPAPVVTGITLTPASLTLASGATQQYSVTTQWSDGATRTAAIQYSASGGTVTSGGLFTAGATAGTFKVIASCSGCSVADTSTVTIPAPPPPPPVSGTVMTISPKTITIDLGEVYKFSATARLADGTTVTAPVVTWSSSNGEINSAGWYRAPRTAGTYSVTVRYSDGATDQATVTVTVPTAPYFTDNFDGCTLNKTANPQGFLWRETQGGNPTELPAVTSTLARSGGCSLRFTFVEGIAGDDAWSEQRFTLGKRLSEIYMQWYQYWPTGTESPTLGAKFSHRNDTGPDNNKFLRLWDDDYNQYRVKLGFSTLPTSTNDSQLITEYGTNLGGVGPFGSAYDGAGISAARRGRWVKITVHVRLASAANNDGVIELWVDGVKTITNTTLPMYPTGGVGNYIKNGYLMGWANSGFAATTSTFVDDVIISGVPIP